MNITELKQVYDVANLHDKWKILYATVKETGITELWKENKRDKCDYASFRNARERIPVLLWHYVGRRIPIINKLISKRTLGPKYIEYYILPTWHYEFLEDAYDIQYNIERYKRVYDSLGDEKSKEVLCNILMARVTKDNKYYRYSMEISSDYPQYFDKSLLPTQNNNDVFVDCGGYIGDSVERFIENYNSNYKKIYMFEPERNNIEIAKKTLSNYRDIEIIEAGVGREIGELYFQGSDSGGRIQKTGNYKISVRSIDDIVKDPATFIKMDIEGAEKDALCGAKQQIVKYSPTLAICAYHLRDDIYSIYEQIKSYRDDYSVYLRHYSDTELETVLYFIPASKLLDRIRTP